MRKKSVYGITGMIVAGAAAAVILIGAAGCARMPADTVVIGSKDFTEQFIIAEIMAGMIEGNTAVPVRRRFNLGGTMICHNALIRGDIDAYAEYTGTALTAILKQPVMPDPDQVYARVKEAYAIRFSCLWLEPFGFNNTYTITVREDFASEHGFERISDLEPVSGGLTAGFTAEFAVREDGYPGLRETYGFSFGEARDMDPSLMYRAVARGDADVICAFATDGRIAAYGLRSLEDDKGFFPPYHAAPVVRQDLLERHPDVVETLALLAGLIDDETMRELNRQVDEEGRSPAAVAGEFLVEKGLVSAR